MNNFDEDIRDHYQALENDHMEKLHVLTVYSGPPPPLKPPMNILTEQIIEQKYDD